MIENKNVICIFAQCRRNFSHKNKMFLLNGVLKICIKFTGEHPCRSLISIKLLCNFIEIALQHGCSPVNLLHIFRTIFQMAWFCSFKFTYYIIYNYTFCDTVKIILELKLYAYSKDILHVMNICFF